MRWSLIASLHTKPRGRNVFRTGEKFDAQTSPQEIIASLKFHFTWPYFELAVQKPSKLRKNVKQNVYSRFWKYKKKQFTFCRKFRIQCAFHAVESRERPLQRFMGEMHKYRSAAFACHFDSFRSLRFVVMGEWTREAMLCKLQKCKYNYAFWAQFLIKNKYCFLNFKIFEV